MNPWQNRPPEIANLFNPAFCALVIREALLSYYKERDEEMPFSLVFLLLPIVLHQETRGLLPKRDTVLMIEWCDTHLNVLYDFPSRAKRLVPFTKEAIIFGVQKRTMALSTKSSLKAVGTIHSPSNWTDKTEPSDCLSASRLVGRWFAATGAEATIYRLWGVKP
ncbi:hypothetical protein EKD04_002365 [Chloroflexales bacterium ZM16-3]|nr:hypothetical protein [Chloroflexales bacterium ZM16-3]